tara:strand:+ start:867 stop:2060 length:1194 start_codon:yes stop_codon:yes gene_type:complete
MATTFKSFSSNDVISTKTLLHEAVPVTGAICSGTYADGNIKNYAHGQFQSVYDYPYLSSSANHIFDLAIGYSPLSALSGSAALTISQKKKFNMYNQMAQVLMGFDHTGSVQMFDEDGDLLAGGTKIDSAYFMNFSRLLVKDEIKKGSFTLDLGVGSDSPQKASSNAFTKIVRIKDTNAQNDFRVNSPAGEYGILYASVGPGSVTSNVLTGDPAEGATTVKAGLIYYQAGIVVLTSSILLRAETGGAASHQNERGSGLLHASLGGPLTASAGFEGTAGFNSGTPETAHQLMTGSNISASLDAIRARIYNVSFNNTTELNSTVYFCRANHNEFNYSSNPTYLTASKLRVKQQSTDTPVSFVTTVGLYSADNELMAVAKLSEPLRKDPTNEMTLRVRLDY